MKLRKNISIDSLLRIIKTSKDQHLVRRAYRRLSFKVDKEPRANLVKRLKEASDPLLKKLIKQRLWEFGLDQSFDSLVNVIKTSKTIDKVGFAVDMIGVHRYKNGFSILIKLLKHKHWYIRNRAALSLREYKSQKALNPLVNAIKKTDMNTSVSNLVYSLEVLDCSSILEFLTNLYLARISKGCWLTRIDIVKVIEKIDWRKVKIGTIKRSIVIIHKAMLRANDYYQWENLQDLCDAIGYHRLQNGKDLAWDSIKSDAELSVIKKSLKGNSKNPYLLRKLTEFYYKQKQFAKAEKPISQAYSLARKNALNIWSYAIVKANLNQPEQAIKLLKTILKMSPKSIFSNLDTNDERTIVDELKTDSRYNLAQCYWDLGDKYEAKHWFKSYIEHRKKGKPSKFTVSQAQRKLVAIDNYSKRQISNKLKEACLAVEKKFFNETKNV